MAGVSTAVAPDLNPAFIANELRVLFNCRHSVSVRVESVVESNRQYLIISHSDDEPLRMSFDSIALDMFDRRNSIREAFASAFPHQRDPSSYSASEYRLMVEAL